MARRTPSREDRIELRTTKEEKRLLATAAAHERSDLDLLMAAGTRALAVAQEVGGVALAIDAKNAKATDWYERFGALRLLDDQFKLVLPLSTIEKTISAKKDRS